MSPLQALADRQRVSRNLDVSPTGDRVLRLKLSDIPADLMLAFTADLGWHWAYSPPEAVWEALEA